MRKAKRCARTGLVAITFAHSDLFQEREEILREIMSEHLHLQLFLHTVAHYVFAIPSSPSTLDALMARLEALAKLKSKVSSPK